MGRPVKQERISTSKQIVFARRTFLFSAVYGLIVLLPQYFLESKLVPPTTHPEQFYGFVGLALAWQFAFILISQNVVRYCMLMLVAMVEKLAFGLPVLILYLQARVSMPVLALGLIDLLLCVLFCVSFFKVRSIAAQAA